MPTDARAHPFVLRKIAQVARLVQESYTQPLQGGEGVFQPVAADSTAVTFIGHSSFLLQTAGKNLLIDPVFATRLVVLRRQRRPGLRVEQLPPIDLVLLTHAHMDHMNLPSLRRVVRATRRLRGTAPAVVVPHGVADLVAGLGFAQIYEMRWWQQRVVQGVTVTMTPARHWGARLFRDTHRGYGGYCIAGGSHSVYHAGDTASFDGFREVGRRLRPQLALLPIGAYYPDTYRAVHTSPEEALQGFLDTGAQWLVPMHYGTFRLGREPMDEPPRRLRQAAEQAGVAARLRMLAEGDTLDLATEPIAGESWQQDAPNVGRSMPQDTLATA
ncbi:MAG: MBL fold metallo-hydrolase [Acidobacteriota bacterium]|nr:MBL fold metallo-hydrolase [Acidobacteriota bacterium]